MTEISYILPLALLPGVALLIVSTAARYGQLHDELHRSLDHPHTTQPSAHLHQRARYFHWSLGGLYLCVVLFALGSFGGLLLELLGLPPQWVVAAITGVGCVCLLLSAIALFRESLLSLTVIEQHLDYIAASKDLPT